MWIAQMLICLLIEPTAIPAGTAGHTAISISQQPSQGQTFRDFERRPATLSEEEFQDLKNRVASRCHVSPQSDPAKAPWYFHYELGIELAKRGDPQRALDALIEAIDRRPEPQRRSRMYGMWFTDYLPYFEIAKAHAVLGNWQCAADALRLSAGRREVMEDDEEFLNFLELSEEMRAHLQGTEP